MLKKAIWPVVLSVCCSLTLCAGTPQSVAQAVVDRLYATNGNYQFKKPKFFIAEKNNKGGAVFESWRNTIYLDQRAYEICRSFGPDSLNALAFILGHELVHAYQAQRKNSNFLAYTQNYGSDVRLEKSADIQGLFNAQLSGYQAIRIMPQVIEKVYEVYKRGKVLPGYPSMEERKASATEVKSIAQNLLDIFESSNYLSVIGEHELAIAGYKHILQYYQGIEIYNNLGIANVLTAQKFWNPATDKFIYPLEVDWYTKISQISRGPQALDPTQEPFRMAFLDEAAACFKTAARLNPNYMPAHINLVSTLNLMGKPVEALKYGELKLLKPLRGKRRYKGPKQDLEMAEIAMAITYALYPGGTRKKEAEAVFQRLSGSTFVASALYAQQNLRSLYGTNSGEVLSAFELPQLFKQQIAGIQLGRATKLDPMPLDEKSTRFFAKQRSGESTTYVFSNDRGSNLVTLLRFQNRNMKGVPLLSSNQDLSSVAYRNILAARDGFYVHSKADNAVVKVDGKGRVLEMVKYELH
jgi:tetratricopeptide (TPR) repeat protein